MDYIDPYRELWMEARSASIRQVRLLRQIVLVAPPESGPFHRDLIEANMFAIRAIERRLALSPWGGA